MQTQKQFEIFQTFVTRQRDIERLIAFTTQALTLSRFSTGKYELQALFDEALDAMLIADDTGYYVDANPAACELMGVSREEILTRSIADFTEQDVDFSQLWQWFLEQGRVRGEFRIRRPDGTVRETEYTAVANFVPHRHLSILRDVTERKRIEADRNQIENELLNKQRLIDQIAESMPAILYVYDLCEKRNIYANRQLTEVLGWSAETVQTRGTAFVQTLIHPDDRVKVAEIFQQLAQATDEQVVEADYRMRHATGEWVWLYIRNLVLTRNADRSPRQILGTATDITRLKQTEQQLRQSQANYRALSEVLEQRVQERTAQLRREISDRQQAEIALRHSEQQLRLITDSLPVCISYQDQELRYRFVNKTYEAWFGCNGDKIYGRTVREFIGEAAYSAVQQYIERVLAGETVFYERELPYRLGGRRYVSGTLVPDFDAQSQVRGYYALIADITDRKLGEDRLRTSLQEKEVLLAEIHHRVKNNLYVICSLLELQTDLVSDPQAKAALDDSCHRVTSMALVHENLYRTNDFSGIDFADYVQQLALDLLQTYESLANKVMLNFDADPVFLSIDQAIPCGLLLNELITNALKHGFPSRSSGQVYIRITSLADGWIELSVGNDGDRLPNNFDIKQNASMGLMLVMMFVEQLAGTIDVERGEIAWFKVKFSQSYIK